MHDIIIEIREKACVHVHHLEISTPQPLYNTIVGVQANFSVSYPIRVIMRVKCIVK